MDEDKASGRPVFLLGEQPSRLLITKGIPAHEAEKIRSAAHRRARGVRLRNAGRARGYMDDTAASTAVGIAERTFKNHANGMYEIRPEILDFYARQFRVNLVWLRDGTGPRDRLAGSPPSGEPAPVGPSGNTPNPPRPGGAAAPVPREPIRTSAVAR